MVIDASNDAFVVDRPPGSPPTDTTGEEPTAAYTELPNRPRLPIIDARSHVSCFRSHIASMDGRMFDYDPRECDSRDRDDGIRDRGEDWLQLGRGPGSAD